jgi:energy-coupling factor transporter ATP-binding protein EcfA2
VLGSAEWQRQDKAYQDYQQWLRENPGADAGAEGVKVVDNGGAAPQQLWTYIAEVTAADGTKKEVRVRNIEANTRLEAEREGRHEVAQRPDVDHIDNDRTTKPRGKPFKKGGDERRKQEQAGGQDDGQQDGQDSQQDQSQSGSQQDSSGDSDSDSQQDQDPTLRDFARALNQAMDDAAAQPGGTQQQQKYPDLLVLRKNSPVLEGYDALRALSEITVGTVEPIMGEVVKAIEALDAKPGADPEKIKAIALEAVKDALERMALDPEQTAMVDGKTLRETIEEIAGEAAPKLPDIPKEAQVIKVKVAEDGTGTEVAAPDESDTFNIGRRVHEKAQEVVDVLMSGENVLLIGPTGCGKTVLARDVADILQTRFGSISVTAGVSEGAIIGRWVPKGGSGEWGYVGTQFVDFYENGGLWLWDEMDAADPNALLIANQALSNGHLPLPSRMDNPVAQRSQGTAFYSIGAANTYGTGANRIYVGRNQQDDAALDRVRIGQIEMDYDRGLEATLVPDAGWVSALWDLRDKINASRLRRNLSTRFVVQSWNLHTRAGWSLDKCLSKLTAGWSHDELTKVGLGK